jgi:hypothetical protein
MSKTRWAVDGPDGTVLEINGRKFGAEDDGAPMMCSLYCSEMGRHVHLDYCRAVPGTPCQDAELQHISTRLQPNPDRPKDWISHRLYWRRTGTAKLLSIHLCTGLTFAIHHPGFKGTLIGFYFEDTFANAIPPRPIFQG